MMRPLLATCALVALLGTPAMAQESAATPDTTPALNSAAPVEISADKGLVWDRTAHTYTAKGHAEARQGDMKVTSDVLVARYDAAGSSSDIREVTATGNVVLNSPPYTAYGDSAVYNLTSGTAVLTGDDLRVMTPGETLTARDRLTYEANSGRMTAEGNAKLTRPTDSLEAQTLTATFATLADGKRGLDTVTATGGVVIKTARETITGNKGVYLAATQRAELTGNVVITQGKNRLEGKRATVDMKSGISQLYGSETTGGRVKGVFYPKDNTAQNMVQPVATTVTAPVSAPAPIATPAETQTQAPAVAPTPLPTPDVVTDSVKEKVEDATPAGEPVSPAQQDTVAKDVAPQPQPPAAAQKDAAAAQEQQDLPAEPFAVPPANAENPTAPAAPVAVDKPDLNP